jgi:digeranylgeranylglycerophospholipid reductase
LTGGGIISAMTAGQIAGEVAAEAIRKGDVSKEGLKAYPERWDKAGGKEHRVLYRLKKAAFGLNDRALNRTAHSMVKLPAANRDFVTLFKTAFIKTPSIWVDVVRVFT